MHTIHAGIALCTILHKAVVIIIKTGSECGPATLRINRTTCRAQNRKAIECNRITQLVLVISECYQSGC
jgi:hypothetical protein